MGTTLTGSTVASTYPGYIKTGDNGLLSTPKVLSDGVGNDTALTLAPASGASSFSGTLTSLGNFTVGSSAFVVTASNGNLAIATNRFAVAGATGNTAIAGTLNVTGACVFSSTGNFSGNLSTSQTLTCRALVQNDGAATSTFAGAVTVAGATTFNGSVQFNSLLTFASAATFNAGLTSTTIAATTSSSLSTATASSMAVSSFVTVGTTLSVTGNATFSGNVVVSGNISGNGNVTIGDAAADTLTLNASNITIPNIASKASPVAADRILIRDSAASNAVKDAPLSAVFPTFYSYLSASPVASMLSVGTPYLDVAHSLGSTPRIAMAFFECTSSYSNFLTGDRIPIESVVHDQATTNFPSFAFTFNGTTWTLAVHTYFNSPSGADYNVNKTGGTASLFDPTKWKIAVEMIK